MTRLAAGCALSMLVSSASAQMVLPAFWVEAVCKRGDKRCSDYLMEAHQRVYSGALAFPAPYCPRPTTQADEAADFVYAARWYQNMAAKPGLVTADEVIAAMAANVIPCR